MLSLSMLSNKLMEMVKEVTKEAIDKCALEFKFSSEEAYRLIGIDTLKIEKNVSKKSRPSTPVMKSLIPLPYSGSKKEECCNALRQNNGLYTQCQMLSQDDNLYCNSCEKQMTKSGLEIPEYGTIEQRQSVDIFEYVDPQGRKPVAYSKVMKKYKITKESALEEALKIKELIDERHFEVVDNRRRKKEKEVKEVKSKGRPKKSKKVIELNEDEGEDLFATLVASVNEDSEKQSNVEEEEAKLAEEKAAKEAKAAKLAEEKAAKEAKLAEEKLKKEEEKAKKSEKNVVKKEKKSDEDEEEADVVKKIEINGKKYLKSKKSGIIYDYEIYKTEGDQVVIGKWNESKNQIDFNIVDEESEDEYESD